MPKIYADLTETWEHKRWRESIARAAAKQGIVLESKPQVRQRDAENRKFILEREAERQARYEAERKLKREIAEQTREGAVVGHGIENRFTEPVNEWLPLRVQRILTYGVDRRGVYVYEDIN